MTIHQGSCHCGAIRLELAETPVDAAECDCSLCRRLGGVWHHCHPDRVTIAGEGKSYIQGDRLLANWHCPTCGCITHWTAIDPEYGRMGVNLRMFEPELWTMLPRRQIDGASY